MKRYVFKIDKDNARVFDEFREDWKRIAERVLKSFGLDVKEMIIKPSPSRRGYHIWVHAEGDGSLKNKDIVKIQYLLGDDETRSYLALMRIERGIAHWNKMFSKVVWKREQDYQLKKCLEILKKKKISKEEKEFVADYLERTFYSLKDIVDKIKDLEKERKE